MTTVGLFVHGHPRAAHWLEFAETELKFKAMLDAIVT